MRADEYTGNDQIRVGNGQGLQISHTGLASIPSESKNFSSKNLLHVPQIQKNLLSINKFTCDNHVFIEFHPTCFHVKDLKSRKLLLQGPIEVVSTHGPLLCLKLPRLLLSLVNVSLSINGTFAWVILLFVLFVMFFPLTSFQSCLIKLTLYVLHANRESCISFIFLNSPDMHAFDMSGRCHA
jgi:hypothetical protein